MVCLKINRNVINEWKTIIRSIEGARKIFLVMRVGIVVPMRLFICHTTIFEKIILLTLLKGKNNVAIIESILKWCVRNRSYCN